MPGPSKEGHAAVNGARVFADTRERVRSWLGSLGTEEAGQRLARSLEASRLAPDEFVAAMAPSMFSPSAEGELAAPFLDSVRAFRPSGFWAMALASYEDQRHVLAEVDLPTLLLYADHEVRAPV